MDRGGIKNEGKLSFCHGFHKLFSALIVLQQMHDHSGWRPDFSAA